MLWWGTSWPVSEDPGVALKMALQARHSVLKFKSAIVAAKFAS
jgi:hypothetical protein